MEERNSSTEQKMEFGHLHFFHRDVQERDLLLLPDGRISTDVSSIPVQDQILG